MLILRLTINAIETLDYVLYLDVFNKKPTVFADELVIKRSDNAVRRKKKKTKKMVKCRRIFGLKANARPPGWTVGVGKCPIIVRGGGGGDGRSWN